MALLFDHIVIIDYHVRSTKDRRVYVDRTIVSYRDPVTKDEYRKSFETPCGKGATILAKSTHDGLAAMKYQGV